jgi:hypothetical protein
MLTSIDQLFAACLLGGGAVSVLMFLSAGMFSRLRMPRLRLFPKLHWPRMVPRVRLPRLRLGRPRAAIAAKSFGPGHQPSSATTVDTALIPPGMLPVFVALLTTFFGAIGLLCRHTLQLSDDASLLGAAMGSLVATLTAAVGIRRYFLTGAAAGEVRGGVLLGAIGHVSIAIPDGGVGAIAYVVEGHRVTMPARSRDGQALPQRARVMIMDVVGHTAVVEEL